MPRAVEEQNDDDTCCFLQGEDHCEWAVMNEKEGWEPLQWLPMVSSLFFVLHHWSSKLGFAYADKKQWDISAYRDDTLNTADSLNDHKGTAAYLCSAVSIQEPLSQLIWLFLAVNSLRTQRRKF